MLTLTEIIELKEKLTNGSIETAIAVDLFWKDFKEDKRAWHSKDWKERRNKLINGKCEVCGSQETLTIQHLSHPKKFSEYKKEVTTRYSKNFITPKSLIDKNQFSGDIIENYEYKPIPLCSNCKSRRINLRIRKSPQFLCTECRHEFEEPYYKSVNEIIDLFYENSDMIEVRDKCFVTKDQWRNQHNLSNAMYWLQREKVKVENGELIEKEAFLFYLDDIIKYLSFEDAITACKKCAFNFDINKLELCPKCKENYKVIQYPTCIPCLPEELRKSALVKIEFGKNWNEMHKKLGLE